MKKTCFLFDKSRCLVEKKLPKMSSGLRRRSWLNRSTHSLTKVGSMEWPLKNGQGFTGVWFRDSASRIRGYFWNCATLPSNIDRNKQQSRDAAVELRMVWIVWMTVRSGHGCSVLPFRCHPTSLRVLSPAFSLHPIFKPADCICFRAFYHYTPASDLFHDRPSSCSSLWRHSCVIDQSFGFAHLSISPIGFQDTTFYQTSANITQLFPHTFFFFPFFYFEFDRKNTNENVVFSLYWMFEIWSIFKFLK